MGLDMRNSEVEQGDSRLLGQDMQAEAELGML
jgi:hypothetical protein